MVNKFCPKKHMCVKYKYNNCEGCEDAHTLDLGTKTNFKVKEFTYSEYKNKGENKMKNKDCPYRYHCKSYAIDGCEGCSENMIKTSINSLFGKSIYEKSNIDIPSAYPDMVRKAMDNMCVTETRLDDITRYTDTDVTVTMDLFNTFRMTKKPEYPKIKNVKISGPCTIIFWEDGTKTVMRCSKIDSNHFDAEKAILLAFYRKVTGFTKTHAQKELDKLTNEAYENIFIESVKG